MVAHKIWFEQNWYVNISTMKNQDRTFVINKNDRNVDKCIRLLIRHRRAGVGRGERGWNNWKLKKGPYILTE